MTEELKTILLTGSGGFIGKHLLKTLSSKYKIIAPRSSELDLLDEKAVKKYFSLNKFDFVIHSASLGVRISPDAKDEIAQNNIKMFNNIAKNLPKNCFMINLGSGAEYDKSRALVKVKESEFGQFVPKEPYGYSKYVISKEIKKHNNIINLSIFALYGEGEHPSRVTTYLVTQKLKNQLMQMNQDVVYSFIYVDDFCKIVEKFLQKWPKNKFINVASSETIKISELCDIVNNFAGKKCSVSWKKEGLNLEYTADNTLLLQELPNFRFTSIKEGLENIYDFLKKDN